MTREVEFDFTHKKQTGGSGQYGRIIGTLGPSDDGEFHFNDSVRGGNIPREYIPSVQKGFRSMHEAGTYIGAPLNGMTVNLVDGSAHSVDSSRLSARLTALRTTGSSSP